MSLRKSVRGCQGTHPRWREVTTTPPTVHKKASQPAVTELCHLLKCEAPSLTFWMIIFCKTPCKVLPVKHVVILIFFGGSGVDSGAEVGPGWRT